MTWHGYFAAEDLNLTTPQRTTLIGQLQLLGERNSSNTPNERNHWRVSNDGSKVIFEAVFNDNVLDINTWKQRLANLFGVDVGDIDHSIATPTFDSTPSLVVTFTYNSINRFRVGLFGGVSATYLQSRAECKAYMIANAADWNPE